MARELVSLTGLDRDSPAFRLYQKAKRLGTWDPAAIDFSTDREQWPALTAAEQDLLLRSCTLFLAGEESVVLDLLPLMGVIAQEGRLEEELYLTSFLWEEGKHTEFFRRFLDDVAGEHGDLTRFYREGYRQLFAEELPTAMFALHTDPSPAAQAKAVVTYTLIVEGVLAEGGMKLADVVSVRGYLLSGDAVPAYRARFKARLGDTRPASTLVVVSALVTAQLLAEIEVVAVAA
jgi:ribonucleoside-diphosphate reductase beta chain